MESFREQIKGINDLADLKRKQGNKRTIITKAKTAFDNFSSDYEQLDIVDIEKKFNTLTVAIEQHGIIVERIAEIEDTSFEADFDDSIQDNLAIHKLYQNRITAFKYFGEYATIMERLETIFHDEDIMGSETQQQFYDKLKTCDQFQKNTASLLSLPEVKLWRSNLEQIISRIRSKINKAKTNRDVEAPVDISPVPAPPRPSTHLKLELPKFSGQIVDWHRFWGMYEGRIERETALTDLEKIGCPEDAMKSEEAKDIIRQAAQSRSYAKVVEALKREYDQPRLIFNHHLVKMLDLKTVKDDNKSLGDFLRTIENHVDGMKVTKGYTAEQLLCGILSPLLTGLSKQEWKTHISTTQNPPTLKQLTEFLMKRKAATRDNRPVEDQHTMHVPNKVKSKPIGRVLRTQESTMPICQFCQQGHYTYRCPTLLGQSVEQRNESIRQKKLCYNCLSKDHGINNCTSKNKCKECGRKHHSLLHRNSSAQSSQPITNVAPVLRSTGKNSLNSVLLQTALVDVTVEPHQQRTRAILDPGAAMSLITSRLVNSLNAKKFPSNVSIISVAGSTPSNSIVHIKLTSPVNPSAPPLHVQAHVVDHICSGHREQNLDSIKRLDFLQGKKLADPYFGKSGKVDLLIGIKYTNRCRRHMRVEDAPDRDLCAIETMFGWVIGGDAREERDDENEHPCFHVEEEPKDQLLRKFWEQEEIPAEDSGLIGEEQQAIDCFETTTTRLKDGRYQVRLPRRNSAPDLGESRSLAEKRFLQNEHSLCKKGKLRAYEEQVADYAKQGHAEIVPPADLQKPANQTFYLPMHGVEKPSSTTTKLRVVCDASAKTTSGLSLNDVLLPGPSLYPRLTTVLQRFRLYDIAFSADISKMFREVSLHPEDRDLHRFIVRNNEGKLEDWRMSRVTFGVTSSQFLATATLRRVAQDYSCEHFTSNLVQSSFYVDDFLHGTNSIQEALEIRQDINTLLERAQMKLRKWRTNSSELMSTIPMDLRETEPLYFGTSTNAECPKALGVHWDTHQDMLFVATPKPLDKEPTKRLIASQAAKMFDVLGWFAPITVKAKHLLQLLWKSGVSWDQPIPTELIKVWSRWNEELPMVNQHPIPRKLVESQSTVKLIQLHGFSDASQVAYGVVIYARFLHKDTSVTISLLTAKTRIAPVKELSIPRLELCAAKLLAKLLVATASEIHVSTDNIYGWCDSTAVLGWLRSPPSKGPVFVRSRVAAITDLLPASKWHYVSTHDNPADLASRGVYPKELLDKELWWKGPQWLIRSPASWPIRTDIGDLPIEEQLEVPALIVQPVEEPKEILRFSSFHRLVKFWAYARRWLRRVRKQKSALTFSLSSEELQQAEQELIVKDQQRYFNDEYCRLVKNQLVAQKSSLSQLAPFIGATGVIQVGGRLQNSQLPYSAKHPIVLHKKSHLLHTLLLDLHKLHSHANSKVLMAITAERYYVSGLRSISRKVVRNCVPCRRVNAIPCKQLMGQLPAHRVCPAAPFQNVGLDYAGPFTIKRGHIRKPTFEKVYVAVFVCMVTRSIHLELVSNLTTDAFIAAFKRFVNRRGLPDHVYSDNGCNFVGAQKELQTIIYSSSGKKKIENYSQPRNIQWHFIPVQSAHQGGLWEAGVREMKRTLMKVLGNHKLLFEDFTTLLTDVEATLNSRPIAPFDSNQEDGCPALTPGHFLIGRPLLAAPTSAQETESPIQGLRRWNLVKRLTAELRAKWHKEFLNTCQQRSKWQRPQENLQVGDIVGIREASLGRYRLPLARVTKTYPGDDKLVRVVDVYDGRTTHHLAVQRLSLLLKYKEVDSSLTAVFPPGRMFGPDSPTDKPRSI